MTPPRSVAVVGASLAGLSAVRALRSEGYTGTITVIGDEPHMPYDRPPLSKEFLSGDDSSVALLDEAAGEAETLGATWLLGLRATGISASGIGHEVRTDDGTSVHADAVIVATGARARTLPGTDALDGVHTLRTFDDARALRKSLASARRLVVIGAGFIGAEVASSAAALGLEVTVVEVSPEPLAGVLGPQVGSLCAARHRANGVGLLTGVTVEKLLGTTAVTGVELGNGLVLRADAVVIGIGAIPNVEWAAESGLEIADGFVTDARCRTTIDGIYAIGDCARSFDEELGAHHRSEHWTNAITQAKTAARTVMGASHPPQAAPYFWSNQYDKRLQFAGRRQPSDEVEFVDGNADTASFTVVYERDGEVVAVFAMDNPRLFTRYRKNLERGRRVTVQP